MYSQESPGCSLCFSGTSHRHHPDTIRPWCSRSGRPHTLDHSHAHTTPIAGYHFQVVRSSRAVYDLPIPWLSLLLLCLSLACRLRLSCRCSSCIAPRPPQSRDDRQNNLTLQLPRISSRFAVLGSGSSSSFPPPNTSSGALQPQRGAAPRSGSTQPFRAIAPHD